MPTALSNPTLADIARQADVSVMTVSRALRGIGRVGVERRKQIVDLADALGYRPNHAARSTATGRFNAVTIVLSTDPRRSSLPRGVLEGIHEEFGRSGVHVNVAILPDEALGDAGVVPELLRQTMSDGLLINYTDNLPANLQNLIDRYHLPAVWINHKQPNDAVYPDDYRGSVDLVGRLIRAGHRKIVYVDFTHAYAGGERHYSSIDRRDGYLSAMVAGGLEPTLIFGETGREERLELIRDLLGRRRPTAVAAYGSFDAYAVAYEAALLGLHVPHDLSLATFDNRPWGYMGGFNLATAVVNEQAVGEQAAKMLLRKIELGQTEQSIPVPLEWDSGDSVSSHGSVSLTM